MTTARRRKLGALRLVRDDTFAEPTDYPRGRFRCESPETVVQFMRPYVEREEVEVFWLLALNRRSADGSAPRSEAARAPAAGSR